MLVLGDSLSAEYGLERNTGWVRLLDERLKKSYPDVKVVNASLSGETTAGGKARLPALLKRYVPSVVIIELGGNDGLRGFPVKTIQANLSDMIDSIKKEKGNVLLLGMEIPPNYGSSYTRDFSNVYRTVSKKDKVTLVPFFLKNVADKAELFQADRIHPTVQAQPVLLDNVWPYLKPLLN
ncbi:arylesterase [Oxalobacter paraformigenes]|uniref:arylesterase n=1 Tax=Oxalobacter paraformigenes TaxID=556268 RepID=UPI00267C5A41|nr:arylesterase [Oxalobacter paraformigenes]